MEIAEVFQSGNLQAIRFPKTFHLEADKVEIHRHQNQIILIPLPKNPNLEEAFYALTSLSDDFMAEGRQQPLSSNTRGFLMFMLDTDTGIYIKKHKPPQVLKKFQMLSPADVCMSAITFAELMNGALKSQLIEHNLAKLNILRQIIRVEPFDENSAEMYGYVRSSLERKGTIIGSNDLLIAAHALSQKMTLVTNNEREFSRVEGLLIVNWVHSDTIQ